MELSDKILLAMHRAYLTAFKDMQPYHELLHILRDQMAEQLGLQFVTEDWTPTIRLVMPSEAQHATGGEVKA